VATVSHAWECNYWLRLPTVGLPVYGVNICCYNVMELSPLDRSMRCELGEIYCYYEARAVPVR